MERKSLAQKMQEMKLKQKANEDAEAMERQKRKKTKQAKQDIFGNVEAEVQAELAALKMQRDKGREGYNEYIKSHQEELSEPQSKTNGWGRVVALSPFLFSCVRAWSKPGLPRRAAKWISRKHGTCTYLLPRNKHCNSEILKRPLQSPFGRLKGFLSLVTLKALGWLVCFTCRVRCASTVR